MWITWHLHFLEAEAQISKGPPAYSGAIFTRSGSKSKNAADVQIPSKYYCRTCLQVFSKLQRETMIIVISTFGQCHVKFV